MTKKILWILMIVFAVLIGLYPGIYFLIDRKFGLLGSKAGELLTNTSWNIGFYTHIILGGLALLTGWTQFNSNFRNRNLTLHRRMGMVYIVAVVLSSISGIYRIFCHRGLSFFTRLHKPGNNMVDQHDKSIYKHSERFD